VVSIKEKIKLIIKKYIISLNIINIKNIKIEAEHLFQKVGEMII